MHSQKTKVLSKHGNSSVGKVQPCPLVERQNPILARWQNKKSKVSKCENSSVGRARPCQGRGRGFESRFSLSLSRGCSSGGIGRHAGLKILWPLRPCGFNSRLEYRENKETGYDPVSLFYIQHYFLQSQLQMMTGASGKSTGIQVALLI